jgi:membrane protein
MEVIRKGYKVIKYILSLRVPIYASYAGYFLILSAFPSLILLLSLLRYAGLEVEVLTGAIRGVIPEALFPAAKRLIVLAYQGTTGGILSFSAITALWSASRGVYGLLTGLNSIYGVREDRGYICTRTISIVYTFLLLLVLVVTMALHVFGTEILFLLPMLEVLNGFFDLRFFLLLVLQTAVFTGIFMVLPNRRNSFMDSVPGALLAASGWLVFSDLYSAYVAHFSVYSSIYGSVYGVALSMLWLYCCISIVFYGGALNAYLIKMKKE